MNPERIPTPDELYGVRSKALIPVERFTGSYHYECPHCARQWNAGDGRRVGFVKAAADRHVHTCRAIVGVAKAFGLSYPAAKKKRLALWKDYEANFPRGPSPYGGESYTRRNPEQANDHARRFSR